LILKTLKANQNPPRSADDITEALNKQNVRVFSVWMQVIDIITVIFFIVDVKGHLFYTFGPNQSLIAFLLQDSVHYPRTFFAIV